jgi:glucose-6-phosphate 1-epimerase
VIGLAGSTYIDKTRNFERVTDGMAPITVGGETDRLYVNTEGAVRIEDASLGRQIVVSKTGSRSTVVWNPWIEKAKAMGDFWDEEYPSMICAETANAADNVVTVGAGESHSMQAVIRVEEL